MPFTRGCNHPGRGIAPLIGRHVTTVQILLTEMLPPEGRQRIIDWQGRCERDPFTEPLSDGNSGCSPTY